MIQATMNDILEDTIKREVGYFIYIVRDGDIILYVGQSFNIYDRLQSHLGLDWRQSRSALGNCVYANLSESKDWTVELRTLEDCEQATLDYLHGIGITWYTTETYYHPGRIQGAVDFAEQALIHLHRPCLNTTYNPHPHPLPEKYRQQPLAEISSSMYLDL